MSEYNPDGILLTHEQWGRITALLTPMQKNKIFKQGIIGDFIPMLDESEDTELNLKYWEHFIPWAPDNYFAGANRLYSDYPYHCVQSHDSTPNPSWTPSSNPALWAPYHATTPEQALPWYPPTGQQDMYLKDEYMLYTDDLVYKATMDTTDSPETYPQAWTRNFTDIPVEPVDPEEPIEYNSNGTEVWSDWIPYDSNPVNLYQLEDKVVRDGVKYIGTVPNNHWVPGEYGWDIFAE